MPRGIGALVVAIVVATGSDAGAGVIDRRSIPAATDRDVARPSALEKKYEGSERGVSIRRIRLEPSPTVNDSEAVVLKFDVRNDTATGMTDIVVSVSLLGPPQGNLERRAVLVRPFRIRVGGPLRAGYSLDYEIQLKNLSLQSDCVPEIEVVSARSLDEDAF
jgi:hypothetical protein